MKVDSSKLKKSSSELTPECRQLIEQITKCHSRAELLQFLESVHIWIYGKCELFHWIDILDRFDNVLEEATRPLEGNEYKLYCDVHLNAEDQRLLLLVLNFTTLLIEHSFSRHLYNSIEHLTQLLSSENMDIVLAVLNLLYMFSKRSNFIPRLSFEKKEMLLLKLFNIAERWGDPNYGLALIDCCMRKPKLEFLYQLFVEYVDENGQITLLEIPDMMDMCNRSSPTVVTKTIIDQMSNPSDAVKMRIAHRVRLVSGFKNDKLRLQFVQARLQAVSVLIYSNALSDNTDKVLYPGFGEELCELIDKEDVHLVEIRAAVLRTLTSMLHFDRNPNVLRPGSRLPKIIQYTGAERQSGTLPLLVRDCITNLTGNGISEKYPLILATSLFSLLYHLASYEIGGHALVKSGMMQSLLRVISWPGMDLEHITFVTRAVRVIDLITNIDIAKFHQNNGLNVFIDRLEKEINSCRKALDEKLSGDGSVKSEESKYNEDREDNIPNSGQENISEAQQQANSDEIMRAVDEQIPERGGMLQSHQNRRHSADSDVVILDEGNLDSPSYSPNSDLASGILPTSPNSQGESSNNATSATNPEESGDADLDGEQTQYPVNSYYSRPFNERNAEYNQMLLTEVSKRPACVTQRAALLKSMLNFLKKSIQDHSHFNGMRNIMETSLPNSLRHIISNAEYYGPSLFLLATDVVTVYVFNEPSLLSSLQDFGLTSIMLQSLLRKDVPATREVLGSLPNVFSALCLNERGLMEFMSYEPFDKLLKVLLSPDYLVAMRRRRSSDPLGDTATNLGNAMDDLMKHHPYLRTDATEAIVRLLNELVRLGSDINFVCWRANKDSQSASGNNNVNPAGVDQSHITNPGATINVATVNNAETAPPTETDHDSSGEDDDDDDEMSSASQQQAAAQQQHRQNSDASSSQPSRNPILEREAIPLIDYILNVMKFIEAIFSNSSNGEHCHEFVLHGGLKPLLQLLSLPNLPVDSPVSTTAQAVANVCKSILNLAHETKVIDTALQQLSQIVGKLKPLIRNFRFPGGSVLLCELLSCPRPEDGFSIADFTPLLHSMSSVHGYVVMLVCLCRNASNEMRSMLLTRWGAKNETGLYLLQNLVQLYISLVWESTILLSLCSDETYAQNGVDLNWEEMSAMLPMIKEVQRDINAMDINVPSADGSEQKFERSSSAFKAKLKPEDQLRYIKSLLAASSRLGRALAELFGTLVKLSVGTPQTRQRRNNDYVAAMGPSSKAPSADAKEIARVLSSILVNGFRHENIVPKPAPKLKLTFLICSVGFTGPMLFDDKRSAFHLMISQFCEENGLRAFFDMFYWTLSLNNPPSKFSYEQCIKMENVLEDCEDDESDLPDGTSEFLDAWLQLLEKMVNPRAILDSPYAISSAPGSTVQFEPVFYMVHIHQLALHVIKRIWKRKPLPNYAVSMTETMMAIIKHLVKSHSVLRVQYNQRLEEIASAEKKKEREAAEDAADVDKDYFKLLVDMGFAVNNVVEALLATRTLEEATDFLLNPQPRSSTPLQSAISHNIEQTNTETTDSAARNAMEVEAIATIDNSSSNNTDALPSTSTNISNNVTKIDYKKLTIIPEKTFSEFCKQALERTFCFMENLPEPIFNVGTELIYVLYRRHSIAERHLFVLNLARELGDLTEQMTQALPTVPFTNTEFEKVESGNCATKLYIRLRVSTILLEETYADMRKDYCTELVHEQTLASLLTLLVKTVDMLDEQANTGQCFQPRWLQVLIEFIDALDNVCTILQRKANMRAVCSDTWKWYDSSTGKWNAYSEVNNTIIKNAFNMGERSVNFNIGRQRYSINFNCMKQVSEASGSHRPVLPSLKINEAIYNYANGNQHFRAEKILTRTIKTRPDGVGVVQQDELICLNSLLNMQSDNNSNNNQTTASTINEEVKSNTATVRNSPSVADAATTTHIRENDIESITTPPLPQSTEMTSAVSEESTETSSTTVNSTEASGTSTATNATAQADDLSMSSTSKKTKNKVGSASKTSVLPKRTLAPVERVKRVILREENVGLAKFNTPEIIACLVRILRPTLRIDFETKLSVLKLCARLTKDYKNARAFYNNFGIARLLNMRQSCGFMGFPTFAIVIIRHMLEPPPVLQDAIERILSMRTWPTLPVGHRDLIYLLTQVSSAVARHPKIFLAAAKQILRADYVIGQTNNTSLTLDDSRLLVRSVLAGNRRHTAAAPHNNTIFSTNPQINVQTEPNKTVTQKKDNAMGTSKTQIPSSKTTSTAVNGHTALNFLELSDIEVCRLVVKDLLRAIIQPCMHYGGVIDQDFDLFEDAPENDLTRNTTPTEGATKTTSSDVKKPTPTLGSTSNAATQQLQDKVEPCCCSWHIPTNSHWHKKPVLTRATLLKILADSVRSYQSLIPRIIIEHVYTPADSILIEKNQSFLSFILDQFLPIVRLQQDPEVSMMSRVLIASLADCYGQNAVQVKVAEEIHAALVRIIALPDSAEKHTRLQVIIGLLPTLIESSMSWNKVQLHRNHMYRILLRQGIMTDLTKIAQYKDLSNSNTLNTIYSILRPMEILLRLTVSPGPLSSKRFYFGTGPNGINTIVNRRFYPRFVTRGGSGGLYGSSNAVGNSSGNSAGGETVLRDIIRNVFADRRSHAFDIFLNADGLFVDSEETSPNNGTSGDDDAEDGEALISSNFSASERNHLNLDRLWDDLMQSDGLRLVNRNAGTNNVPSNSSTSVVSEHHRHNSNDDDAGNNDVSAGGGSDGASSSSETAAVVADNTASLMGEVSTSESDTESNASTENDHNDNDEEDEEDDVVVDANDAGVDDHSETDADEETRQFIEVFERHMFEPESSETASNDADVDVDEDEADMIGNEVVNTDNVTAAVASNESTTASDSTPTSQSEIGGAITNQGNERTQAPTTVTATNSESNSASAGRLSPILNTVSTSSSGSVRTMPTFSWLTPRMSAFDGGDANFRPGIEVFSASLIRERPVNAAVHGVPLNASSNAQPPVGTPAAISSGNTISSANVVGAVGLRRDQTRRLVFLDQQYCSPMPSYTSPTEDGQMELFNQDALHWWLEEAKHLDLESQTDACLYVAHLMVPHLIRELKTQTQKRTESSSNSNNTSTAASSSASSNNRRSAIPVLIQSNTNQSNTNGNNVADEAHNGELSPMPTANLTDMGYIRVSDVDRLIANNMQPIRLNFLTEHDPDANAELQAEAIAENEAGIDIDSEAQAEGDSHVEAEADPSHVEVEDHDDDEGDGDDEDDGDVFSDDVEEDGIGDEDDDFYDDVEEEGMVEDDETGLNSTYFEEEEPLHPNIDWEQDEGALNRTFNMEFEADVIRNMSARPPPLINRPRPASAPASTMCARESSESNEAPVTSINNSSNEPIPEEEESQPSAVGISVANRLVDAFQSTLDEISHLNRAEENSQNSSASMEEQRPEQSIPATTVPLNAASNESNAPPANIFDAGRPGLAAESAEDIDVAISNSFTFGANATVANTENLTAEAPIGIVEDGAGGEPAAAIGAAANILEMSPEVRAALGDLEVPEGVDPSFLAALPSEMREEVIQEHLRMQRIRQRAQQNAIQVAHDALVEVNPEFLAALPPNIQSEVLMQQRIEQQRQAAQNSHPDDPVDTAAFFQNLPQSLRQAILTDMEESQIASLPPDLAAEAQYLRRDWETRNGARLDANSANTLSGYLSARIPSSLQNLNEDSRWPTNSIWYDANGIPQNHPQHHHANIVHHQQQHQMQGKPMALMLMEEENIMLDPDSLATLLLFLFIEDSKTNYARLHRVIRNLCYHVPTRQWVINALISIIKRTNESEINGEVRKRVKPKWLNLRIDAAFGYKSNVFIINTFKTASAIGDNEQIMTALSGEYSITVNPQAAQMVVRNCLDLLFVLAKNFPRSFVPYNNDNPNRSTNETVVSNTLLLPGVVLNTTVNDTEMGDDSRTPVTRQCQLSVEAVDTNLDDSPSTSKAAAVRNQTKLKNSNNLNQTKLSRQLQHYNTNDTSFWDVLLNIDNNTSQRMRNIQCFPLTSEPKWEWNIKQPDFLPFNDSPFAKLLEMLPYKVICRSPQLTDLLIKLLASLSSELPKEEESVEVQAQATTNLSGNATTAPSVSTATKSKNEKDDKDKAKEEEKTVISSISKRRMYAKNFSQLQLVIEVLTHQCGTTDGLDNVSKLIVNLSQCSPASNAIFLQYLRVATLGLAQEVREAIQSLLDEICAYNTLYREKMGTVATSTSNREQPSWSSSNNSLSVRRGIMQDRFTAENIVISASSNIKPTCELQLPAMKRLLSGSSAQPYFLRTLKIFMQIRELFETQENSNTTLTATAKPTLSQIICLDDLWETLSACLVALEDSKDEYAVLVLQPTVEAFFLIHASYKKMPKKRETSSLGSGQRSNATSATPQATLMNNSEQSVNLGANRETAGDVANPTTIGVTSTPPITENKPTTQSTSTAATPSNLDQQQQLLDRQKFLAFAEKHRTVLNQILRQSPTHLSDGPFAVLVDHTRILDFDVKRKYFQKELERIDEGVRREENTVGVRRVTVFEDSFRVLYRLGPEEWKNRFYIVFEDEEGQDAGGLLREWYVIISREIFNPMYALFCVSPGDRVTYMINPSSHANPNHLSYFKFVGRVIAKAIHDNKLLECYFTRSFYKHILGKQVKYTDMESQDYEFYKGLDYLMKNDISNLGYELTFSTEVQEFGVTQVRDLIPNGRDIVVTEENKFDYVQLVCQLKMSDSIRYQLDAFLEGFYDIIPKHLISIFNEQELELLISGLPDIDIEDLKVNTEYHKYTSKSIQIQWFWRALRSFDQADRAKFLQFVTGTSKVPLQGFGSLEGMNGIQKFQIHRDDRSTDRLPCAHTCFNQLDLPMYKSYEKLRSCLSKAIHECSEGFGFA